MDLEYIRRCGMDKDCERKHYLNVQQQVYRRTRRAKNANTQYLLDAEPDVQTITITLTQSVYMVKAVKKRKLVSCPDLFMNTLMFAHRAINS